MGWDAGRAVCPRESLGVSVCRLSPPRPTSHLDQPDRVGWGLKLLVQPMRQHEAVVPTNERAGTLGNPPTVCWPISDYPAGSLVCWVPSFWKPLWTVTLQLKGHGLDLSRHSVFFQDLASPHLIPDRLSFSSGPEQGQSSDLHYSLGAP